MTTRATTSATTGAATSATRAAARPVLPAQRTPVDGRVVVGVDGTPASVAALDWALRLARRRGWTLDVVGAWPDPGEVFVREVPGHFNRPRNRVRAAVERALVDVAGGGERPRTRLFVENTHPVQALLERAEGAQLLVLGDSRWARPRPSTVARACARLAACPVVLVAAPSGTASGP
jgi:nucleotide-binding universal stress UspA family protein